MTATQARAPRRAPRRRGGGFSLVELLVAVVIGMALVLSVTLMLVRQEAARRSMGAVNDTLLGGSYASYLLDRSLRSAGSGFAQAWRVGIGCELRVARDGAALLPRATAFPAPFGSVPKTVYLAPVVVHAGAGAGGSDVIAVASGSSALGETPLRVLPSSSVADGVRVNATVGVRPKDLMLVMEDGKPCLLQQVKNGFVGGATQALPFGGAYAATGDTLAAMGDDLTAWVAPLGNTDDRRPAFQLFGVGDDAVLFAYDLLRLDGSDAVVPIAEGVADLRALYGVDMDDDGRVDAWRSPRVAPFDAASLQSGSAAARVNLGRILSLRVGMLLRGTQLERQAVSPPKLTLFPDLDTTLQRERTLSATEQRMRWRAFEFTVPLRNVMLSPRT